MTLEPCLCEIMVTEPSLSDEALAGQVQEGDSQAFAVLVQRHATRYFRLAYRILRDQNEAEDMVQTAFLKFWDNPKKWNPNKQTRFTTWFYRVLVNQCLDHTKKKRPHLVGSEVCLDEKMQTSGIDFELQEKQESLRQWMGELPERQRLALNLCFYEGLTNEEAAQVMGVKLKALQSLLMRAKSTLKQKADQAGYLE